MSLSGSAPCIECLIGGHVVVRFPAAYIAGIPNRLGSCRSAVSVDNFSSCDALVTVSHPCHIKSMGMTWDLRNSECMNLRSATPSIERLI